MLDALGGNERFDVEGFGWAAFLALNKGLAQCRELCLMFFQQPKAGAYDIAGRTVAALADFGLHEPLKMIEIGRAHVCTPVTNAHLVCRLLLEQKKTTDTHRT